jgi:predicted transglutaminase-like cysteine proteinase
MKNRFYCCPAERRRAINKKPWLFVAIGLACFVILPDRAQAGDAPQWMHAVVNAPLPPHDEKTDAVLLYSETDVSVISTDKIKTLERRAYKILRPEGREYGTALVTFRSPGEKVNSMHGWCIPAQGKDYEVKDKEAIEASLPKVEGAELINDVRVKILPIPAPDPGNVVGYEYEVEENPLVLQDSWTFQHEAPTHESHYALLLPSGWEYKAEFLNHPEVKPVQSGNSWEWTVGEMPGIREEKQMPPMEGVAGQMIISFFPPGGAGSKGFSNWHDMGTWWSNLASGRSDASPEIKQKVAALTQSSSSQLERMRALAAFVQRDIRYVAIELGIGGWQPHPASDVFAHRYGDCKDKATLMKTMLHEIGINALQVGINVERGAIMPSTPAHRGFDHMILAVQLPDGLNDPSLIATVQNSRLGRILFFDPTDEITPFGQINGALQANYGLLVTPDGGELVELPRQPSAMNSIRRTATLTLDPNGNIKGDVEEVRLGDRAWRERWALRTVTSDKDRIKPIENILAGSLSNFGILKASVVNLSQFDQPFGYRYSFQAASYAKNAGGMLLVRPRVLGVKALSLMETKEPRQFPIEFQSPVLDTDNFEITVPAGYVVDDVPPPIDADFGFAAYHSKTEVKGNVLTYSRSFEIKELSVPVSRAQDVKKFYRIIASDERNTAILKPAN